MTYEQIKAILAERVRWADSTEFVEEGKMQLLCDAIEVLMKRLEKCKEQRDFYIKMKSNEVYETYKLEKSVNDKELDEIGSEE